MPCPKKMITDPVPWIVPARRHSESVLNQKLLHKRTRAKPPAITSIRSEIVTRHAYLPYVWQDRLHPKKCLALGGRLPSERDFTEGIRKGLPNGSSTLVLTYDLELDDVPLDVGGRDPAGGAASGAGHQRG